MLANEGGILYGRGGVEETEPLARYTHIQAKCEVFVDLP